jgi:hypothetical protein
MGEWGSNAEVGGRFMGSSSCQQMITTVHWQFNNRASRLDIQSYPSHSSPSTRCQSPVVLAVSCWLYSSGRGRLVE